MNTPLKTASVNKLLPVKEINKLGYAGFAQTGKALLFQYGIDKANPAAKTAMLVAAQALQSLKQKLKIWRRQNWL